MKSRTFRRNPRCCKPDDSGQAPLRDVSCGKAPEKDDGKLRFQPGLLSRAHEGVLYIDEVNLLDDPLVDSILDAAESGGNVVEHEGLSLTHLSRFILIGTMNPEEGELRPQLLDRFGLAVSTSGEADPAVRVELLRRREAFDDDPDVFDAVWRAGDMALKARVADARASARGDHSGFIGEICLRNHVAGHRADIVIARAACAHAAWHGRSDVTADDILAVAPLALLHRMRAGAPEMPPPPPSPSPTPPQEETRDDEESPDRAPSEPPEPQNVRDAQGSDNEGDESAPQRSWRGSAPLRIMKLRQRLADLR